MFTELGPDPDAELLKQEITEVIRWADSNSSRSLQTDLGPSELSSDCDRFLGYRMAGITPTNLDSDPWAAIVGTAIHGWLEAAFQAWCARGDCHWLTETTLYINPVVRGHGDLFHTRRGWVIDHKSAGKDRMGEVRKNGPPAKYVRQIQLYGYGYEQRGYTVNKVALVFYPRAGRLKDMITWVADYDRQVALEMLERVPRLAETLFKLDVLNNPHRWEQVPASPGHDCGYCPFYAYNREPEEGASDKGCPGK